MGEYLIVNGVKMTIKEFKAYKASRKPLAKATKVKKETTLIQLIPSVIADIMNKLSVCRSVVAYRSHGYRQWGTIAKDILNDKDVNPNMLKVVFLTRDIDALIEQITPLARRNSRSVFQLVLHLKWKMADMKEALQGLLDGIAKSHILLYYPNHECIVGEGRRLGLQTLCRKAFKAVREIDKYIADIEKLAD